MSFVQSQERIFCHALLVIVLYRKVFPFNFQVSLRNSTARLLGLYVFKICPWKYSLFKYFQVHRLFRRERAWVGVEDVPKLFVSDSNV